MRQDENGLAIAQLAFIEIFALTARRQKNHSLTADAASRIRSEFIRDVNKGIYFVVPVNDPALYKARLLARKHKLRTLDAIQLACAIRLRDSFGESIIFVASDKELLAAATLEKFPIDDPLLHP